MHVVAHVVVLCSSSSHDLSQVGSRSFRSVANPVPQILVGVQHVPRERVQHRVGKQMVDVPVPQILEEVVELVAGEVVCNARTGVRREHGWTCTNCADRGRIQEQIVEVIKVILQEQRQLLLMNASS